MRIILYYIILYDIILYYIILYIILYTHLPRALRIQCELVKESFLTWRSNIALRTLPLAAPPVPLAQMTQADVKTVSSTQLGPQPRCGNAAVPTLLAHINTHEGFAGP